jgi:glycine oxidase
MRIAVVGGGVIGLACAWRLAVRGHAVTVCDAAPEAREASWAAAGMLAPHHEAERCDELWRFGAESLGLWPAFAAALGGDAAVDRRERGGLIPALDAADDAALEARRATLAAAGVACERLDAAEVRRREPALAPLPRGALLVPGGQADPRRLLAALQAACSAYTVRLRYGAAVRGIGGGAVRLDDGELPTDLVVIASGAWTPSLARASGIALAGEPVKGQLARLRAPDGLLGAFVHSHHAYLVPRTGAGVVVGATMVMAGFDKSQDADAITTLVGRARDLVPALATAEIAETWTGLRPRLDGGRPLIARAAPGVIVATGHFRNGILLAPATAEAVAALAEERAVSPAAAPFTSVASARGDGVQGLGRG